jgi:hypothetical protein
MGAAILGSQELRNTWLILLSLFTPGYLHAVAAISVAYQI